MQITAKKGSVVIDYYPTKNWKGVIFPNEFLRILSFRGDTMNKRIVSESKMEEEVTDRTVNYGYKVTDNHCNRPQFVMEEGV